MLHENTIEKFMIENVLSAYKSLEFCYTEYRAVNEQSDLELHCPSISYLPSGMRSYIYGDMYGLYNDRTMASIIT